MTTLELLARARTLLASGKKSRPFEALDSAARGDGAAFAEALLALDALTPYPFTFLMWADGAEIIQEQESVAIVYRYNRRKGEILALMGQACLRATRATTAQDNFI